MLAGPGVIVATVATACFARFAFPYGWDWNTALYFGAMCSATDPVAVVALMKVCCSGYSWRVVFQFLIAEGIRTPLCLMHKYLPTQNISLSLMHIHVVL